jgi:uncharacterized protein (TIGR01777 family)
MPVRNHVLVTGGTGFIGRALIDSLLADGHRVTVLTRDVAAARKQLPAAVVAIDDLAPLEGVDAVVNLAGENLGSGRWSAARKQRFIDSRVDITRRLVDWMRALSKKPTVLVSGSAIGWYGPRGDEMLDENSAPGDDFSARLCQAWEAEAMTAEMLGLRVCRIRIGVVLGADRGKPGGALKQMLPPFRFGLGGPMGSGRQWMSWVHRDDLVALIRWLIETPTATAAYNGTAPAPETNAVFAAALGRALHRPALLPMPGFALKLIVGEMSAILLEGQKVLPARALAEGFAFRYRTLDAALADVLKKM